MSDHFPQIQPDNTIFVLISFEGPDPYSLAGGLGVRVSELSEALAVAGYESHLIFVGAPDAPAEEVLDDGRHLWRCCRELALRYPNGVYQGVEEKAHELANSVPHLVHSRIVRPGHEAGKRIVVMAEDWHTAEMMCALSDLLYWQGLLPSVLLLWNANSVYGFDQIDWSRLQAAARITAVSRYMKQILLERHVHALVLPNGIPDRHLEPVPPAAIRRLREATGDRLSLVKVARFSPDKNWMPAIQAVARLKALGRAPLLGMRGGMEGYGLRVMAEIENLGLRRYDMELTEPDLEHFLETLDKARREADIIYFRFFIPEEIMRLLYAAADAVLANSRHEPFGLVGLEVMATRGVAFVGSTGEDYAQHLLNAISLDTDDPNEIVGNLLYLQRHPHTAHDLRRVGHLTARFYRWPKVIEKIISKLQYMLMSGSHAHS